MSDELEVADSTKPAAIARKDLQTVWRSSFYISLQLLQCLDVDPHSPKIAAIFALLFQKLELRPSLTNLHRWLDNHVFPFARTDPRSQADQSDRALAIASYLYITYNSPELTLTLHQESLLAYIKYAAAQDWLNDPFLAFFCHFLSDQIEVSQESESYYQAHLQEYLNKKRLIEIAQAVIVLDTDLSHLDKERSLAIFIEALETQTLTLNRAAWALLAVSKLQPLDRANTVARQLADLIDKDLTAYLTQLFQSSKVLPISALVWAGSDPEDVQSYLERSVAQDRTQLSSIELDDLGNLIISFPAVEDNQNAPLSLSTFPIADVGLALFALRTSNNHRIWGVTEPLKDQLIVGLAAAAQLEQGASIVPRWERIFTNIFVFAITIIVGVPVVLFYLNVEIAHTFQDTDIGHSLDFSKVQLNDPDRAPIAIAWIVVLLAEVIAAVSGRSAVLGLLLLPLGEQLKALIEQFSQRKQPSKSSED